MPTGSKSTIRSLFSPTGWKSLYADFAPSLLEAYATVLAFEIVLVLLAGRIPVLLALPRLQILQPIFFYGTIGFALVLLLQKRRQLVLGIGLLWALVLTHAYANFFQPSLNWSIPVEDYLLADHVSAAWSWGVARTEVKNLLGYFIQFLPIALLASERTKRRLLWVFAVSLGVNVLVGLIQNFVWIKFLARGTGTSVSVRRIPGLLEDSGAMSAFLTLTTSGLLWTIFYAAILRSRRIVLTLFTLALFVLGVLGSGRLYVVGVLICFSFLSLVRIYRSLSRKSLWVGLASFAAFVGAWGTLNIIAKVLRPASLAKFQDYAISDLFSLEGWEGKIDYQRTKHIQAMWENTKETWPFGSGLGSFHSFCENIAKQMHWADVRLDWPSSFYLQFLSELGLAGLLLLSMILVLFVSTFVSKTPKSTRTYFLQGAFFSLLIAWLIGIHYIFPSIALCIGAVLAFSWSTLGEKLGKVMHIHFFALTCALVAGIAVRYASAPQTISEFHWQSRGLPQIPNSLEEKAEKKWGRWYRNGSELLVRNSPVYLRLRHPSEYENIVVKFHVFHKERGKLGEFSPDAKRNQWTEWHWPDTVFEQCPTTSPENFCYARVEVKPEWRLKQQKVGVLISTR